VRIGKNAKIAAMAKVPLFERCSKGELAKIASIADEVDLPAGRTLTKEGARGREFFVILEGMADVRRKGRKLRDLADGDFFGEIALVTNVPRTATVTATSPVHALVITDRDFLGLMRNWPGIQLKVLQALAVRVEPGL
jgi:CRP/FNR family cyclic AMP-dependent transcriptional regulator